MERIGVLHDELSRSHHAKPWTNFIPELGLYLKQINRQLFVALDLAAGNLRDDLFVGGA